MWLFVIGVFVPLFVLPVFVSDRVFRKMAKKSFFAQDSYELYRAKYPREECRFFCRRHRLCGYFYGAANTLSPALILVAPGAGCPADGHLPEIAYFVDHGWQVFAYDATALGKSEGKSIRGLPQAGRDLKAALNFAEKRSDLPVVLYAHSAGAYAACRLLKSPRILSAVCISGFDLPLEIMLYHARLHAGPLALLGCPALALRDLFAFGADANRSAISSINATNKPVLLCQDPGDCVVPYPKSLAGKKKKIKNENVRIREISSGHSGAWLSESARAYQTALEEEYRALQSSFFGKLPKEVEESFAGQIDRRRASEPGRSFLDGVLEFFERTKFVQS